MKNIIIAGFALLILMYLLRGKNEPFVNEAIFNEVEIPDASKDPYYQFIKNMEFPCMCSDGKENLRGQCVPVCPAGQTRFTNDLCYPPCPAGQSRHTNAVCYPPCPLGEFRDPAGVCQCNPQLTYDFTPNADVPGFDIGSCSLNVPNIEGCKLNCDNNPNCKAYNVIEGKHCCLKTTSAIPTSTNNNVNYYRKIDTVRNSSGVCVAPCPAEKTRDANGICQWNPCPAEKTRDANGICQWNACPADQTRDANGVCQCIQRPSYEVYNNADVGIVGSDLRQFTNPEGGWPVWAENCRTECNNNPDCKGYNLVHRGGTWGDNWGCVLKRLTNIPTPGANKIDYYRKFEGTLVKGSDGVCRVPCPPGKGRDANNICRWPPCPANSTVNETTGECTCNSGYEVANAFSIYSTSDRTSVSRNQRCDLPCAPGVKRDLGGICGGNTTISIPTIPGLNFGFGQR